MTLEGETCARIYFNTQQADGEQGRGPRCLPASSQPISLSFALPCLPAQSSIHSRQEHSSKVKPEQAEKHTHTKEASVSLEFDLLTCMLLSDRFSSGCNVFACTPETPVPL